jgi:ATP-dependent DNA helicase Q1
MLHIDLTESEREGERKGEMEDVGVKAVHLAAQLQAAQQHVLRLQDELRQGKQVCKELESRLEKATEEASRQPKRRKMAPAVTSTSPATAWRGQFEWTPKVRELLQQRFGFSTFREKQEEAINATLAGHDCFVVMPTGAGKSLLYELPALVQDGLTLVVSPLLSLMQDQCTHLTEHLAIDARFLCGDTSKADAKALFKNLLDPNSTVKLLYVTPEKIKKSKMLMSKLEKVYDAGRLSRIVLDEAHCCSQWGHDFRPDYRELGVLKTQFDVPLLAVTATASLQVQRDCQGILEIKAWEVFRNPSNRPNLFYSVVPKVYKNKRTHTHTHTHTYTHTHTHTHTYTHTHTHTHSHTHILAAPLALVLPPHFSPLLFPPLDSACLSAASTVCCPPCKCLSSTHLTCPPSLLCCLLSDDCSLRYGS